MHKVGAVLLFAFSAASLARAESAQPNSSALAAAGEVTSSSASSASLSQPTNALPSASPSTASAVESASQPASATEAEPLAAAPVAYAGQVTPAAQTGRSGPIASTAFGAMYYQSNLNDVYYAHFSQYALGWYGIEQVNFTKSLGAMIDFDNTYDLHGDNGVNTRTMMAGPVFTVRTKWVRPYVFALGGAVRSSYQGILALTPTGYYRGNGFVEWDASWGAGVGANFKLTHNLAFQLIPGEYVASRATTNQWASNYQAKVGLVLNMFGNRQH